MATILLRGMRPLSLSTVRSKLSEAMNNNLPPIGFYVDYSGTAMTAHKFPEDNCYLKLARPPRGSIEFIVNAYRDTKHNSATLREHVQSFGHENGYTIKFGRNGTIRIGGIDRRAIEFTAGIGLSRKKWEAALIPSPDGGPYGLLLMFGLYFGSSRDRKRVRFSEHPIFRSLIEGFQLVNGR